MLSRTDSSGDIWIGHGILQQDGWRSLPLEGGIVLVSRLRGGILLGVECHLIDVQVDLGSGLPAFDVVGLPNTAIRESRNRVRAAIQNSGFAFPLRRLTVNLAPADLPKTGVGLDLPIAVAILAASGVLPPDRLADWVAAGELSLDGRIQPIPGLLSVALAARQAHCPLLAARTGQVEVAAVPGLRWLPVSSLAEAVLLLRQGTPAGPVKEAPTPAQPSIREPLSLSCADPLGSAPHGDEAGQVSGVGEEEVLDLAEVQGCQETKRALQVALAGAHHLLMVGPPGSGKTMLARRACPLLPAITPNEALQVSQVYSVAGALTGGLLRRRPWRAPHPSCTLAGMVGGGSPLRPGEVSLAHGGILFLDELPHFRGEVLEALRVPLEEGYTRLARWGRSIAFPARFILLAAMNPCPCGYWGSTVRPCRCSERRRREYLRSLSGPFLDRIDLKIWVQRLPTDPTPAALSAFEPHRGGIAGLNVGRQDDSDPMSLPPTERIRLQIEQARERQYARLGAGRCNRSLRPAEVRLLELSPEARRLLNRAGEHYGLSGRQLFRHLTVARTVADLEAHQRVEPEDAAEAIALCRGWQPELAPAAEVPIL